MRLLVFSCLIALALLAPRRADETLKPGDNLAVGAIPPISLDLVERVNRYTEFRSAVPASWHPLRREMLVLTRFADTAQVHLVKMPLGARTQLTFFRDAVGGASFEPTSGESFVFAKDVGGNEFAQLYRFDLGSGESTLITDGTSKNDMGPWSRDGTWLAYTS